MKGLFRRNAPADPNPQEQQPTMVVPQPPPVAPPEQPLPAGLAPEDVAPSRPSFRDRGRLRRRLRYLRRVRELGFRDLGGLAFDLHRFGRRNDDLVLGKLAALDAVDRELRAIERVLNERRDILELREPGVAACPRCGALHGSDARFCPQCGIAFSGPLAMVEVGGVAQPAPEAAPIATQTVGEVSPAEPAPTPVSGALEGNPPPEAPPAVPEPAAAEPAAPAEPTEAEQSAPSGLPGADDAESGASGATSGDNGGEQPTQAFSSLGGPGGDPLAQREHREQ
ncbi:zinc ribbon domain-containing protein [Conexibacter woesei]|uniref:zinc ribbon domain-containing protein n=1 Tax=Conexibacter woesei TaxID=191495 RepID=UPI00041FA914|nr:zinc ribbon domain-containing protein [Conexibacter woesei]